MSSRQRITCVLLGLGFVVFSFGTRPFMHDVYGSIAWLDDLLSWAAALVAAVGIVAIVIGVDPPLQVVNDEKDDGD